jgi:1-acyl-sn-glycerol-3-phosphate acyltransferase
MLDPILIGSHNTRTLYFLARASAFKNKIARKMLNAIHAIAVYRLRDGKEKMINNEEVFKKCTQLLSQNKCVLLFPEGSHNIARKIRPLRGGFVRIAYDFFKENPSKELMVVPVGLNYTNTINYRESVRLIYDKPISLSKYNLIFDKINATKKLIENVEERLKKITVNIDVENYNEIKNKIPLKDFLTPKSTNEKIKKGLYKNIQKINKGKGFLYYLVKLNSLFPFLIWNKINPKIEAVEFKSTFKISLGMVIFPLVYLIQMMVVGFIFNWFVAVLYLFFSVLLVWICTKTK